MKKVLLLITTESNKKLAKKNAKLLIKNKLAACVSIKNSQSFYKWENKIKETKELEITIKSKPKLKNDLIAFLQKNSSYNVPQILCKTFDSELLYFKWFNKVI